jgi:predicted secreted protein with PEFG-CTERM motif
MNVKEYALIAILATIAVVGAIPAFATWDEVPAAPSANLPIDPTILPITVTTDKSAYDHQSAVIISGHVNHFTPGQDIALLIIGPTGNVVRADQLQVDANNNFGDKISTAGPLLSQDGTYTLSVQYGPDSKTDKVQFQIAQIVPEFDSIAALVLAIAIISIIAVSAKTGLRFMPKY